MVLTHVELLHVTTEVTFVLLCLLQVNSVVENGCI